LANQEINVEIEQAGGKLRACELMRGKPHLTNFVIGCPSRVCQNKQGDDETRDQR
jgi:hypothetical protein